MTRRPLLIGVTVALLAGGCADERPAAEPLPRDPVAGLTTRQLAGQRIVVGYAGPRVPAWLLGRVRRGEVGGVIVFTRNIRSRQALAAQMRRLQRASRPLAVPLLTMIDQEGGFVARLRGRPRAHRRRWAVAVRHTCAARDS